MEDLKQLIENSNLIYAAVRNFPNPVLSSEETANDSDKTITVPDGKIWEVISLWVEFITTADAGNRQIQLCVRDGDDDTIICIRAKNVQVASTTEYYLFTQGVPEPTENTAGRHYLPIPPGLIIPGGFDIRIYDQAAIQAAADDMVIQMIVNQYDVS